MAISAFVRCLGEAVMKVGVKKSSSWFTPHMAAASRAILERIPLVDFILEVRDARVPISSQYGHMRSFPSSRRIIVLNKTDLADSIQTREWIKHFEEQNCTCYGINSHNKDNIKEFLNFLQAQVRLLTSDQSKFTITIMLVGIPNVGKSALANSLHQIGRITAAEKGKLKRPVVSPLPGETKDISSLKIASHPNIYVLDTPGVLLPDSLDIAIGSKLALTGAIQDYLVGERKLARYFLAILNLSNEYKHWESLVSKEYDGISVDYRVKQVDTFESNKKRKKIFDTDHTQDFIVCDVRRTLFKTISSFSGNLENENDLDCLIETQFMDLRKAFRLPSESGEEDQYRLYTKLLNLYRTGRLGHYTLDTVTRNSHCLI